MAEQARSLPTPDGRVSTGNPELDRMFHGGLLAGRPYLVVGPSGTGKSQLGLQFLCEGVRRGEEVLIVTLEEPPNEMRANHPGLEPELDRIWVFDAIPDVMRYERTPFKDVAQARDAVRFVDIPAEIRQSPELGSVEVTLTALEQTLKMQRARRSYARLVIDSLTALEYFCMKGLDEVTGGQSFLRFLTELGATTLLTVESPIEGVETPARTLARGEVRLFRWEVDGRTTRGIGVEKFRGSSHDPCRHPYRIGRSGLTIDLSETLAREGGALGRPAHETARDEHVAPLSVSVADPPELVALEPVLVELVGEIEELRSWQLDLASVRDMLERSRTCLDSGQAVPAQAGLIELRGLVHQMRLAHYSADRRTEHAPSAISSGLPGTPLEALTLRAMVDRISDCLGAPATTGSGALPTVEPPIPPVSARPSRRRSSASEGRATGRVGSRSIGELVGITPHPEDGRPVPELEVPAGAPPPPFAGRGTLAASSAAGPTVTIAEPATAVGSPSRKRSATRARTTRSPRARSSRGADTTDGPTRVAAKGRTRRSKTEADPGPPAEPTPPVPEPPPAPSESPVSAPPPEGPA